MNHEPGRILLVVPEDSDAFVSSVLEKLDHPVTTCRGSDASGDCPILHSQDCPSYEDAHGVVFSLDLAVPTHRAILREYQRRARLSERELPIRVVVPPESPPFELLFDAAETWVHEPSVADLDGFAALVEAADRYS